MDNRPNYEWQRRALAAWNAAHHRGIIEAVTGSGKTHVALEALAQRVADDKLISSLIIVPTIPLMEQWYQKLSQRFPGRKIGRIGGEFRETFTLYPLAYVTTIHSALRWTDKLLSHCWENPARFKSLLIADECHHYIDAPVWNQIVRKYRWDYTMGLSATLEPFEVEGFGRIVCQYTFPEAHKDGLVPAFDLLNVGVSLTGDEKHRYLKLTDQIREQFNLVCNLYERELQHTPDHWVFRRLQQLMGKIGDKKEPEIEKLFLLLFQRASVYYMAQAKLELATRITKVMVEEGHKKIIVFFERIAAADFVNENIALRAGVHLKQELLKSSTLWCNVFHSGMKADEKASALDEFRRQGPSALIVCRSLDEGLDIPEVDGAILAASTQSPRQRIQRIGRTLRRGDGTKRPTIVTLFARGTGDAGITDDDHLAFKGVATLHWENEKSCLPKLQSLVRMTVPSPPQEPQWKLLLGSEDGTALEPMALRTLLDNLPKGKRIRIHLVDGQTHEGGIAYRTDDAIRLIPQMTKRIPTGAIQKIFGVND